MSSDRHSTQHWSPREQIRLIIHVTIISFCFVLSQQKISSEVKKQELELLEARALPLRNYLMKYVMPSLTEAMTECSKIKPEDPVDFLVLLSVYIELNCLCQISELIQQLSLTKYCVLFLQAEYLLQNNKDD